MPQFSVCLEMIYEDRPFIERFGRVADLGADAVEFWEWEEKDLDAIEDELETHDLELVGISGAKQPLTDPDQHEAAVEHLEQSVEVADRLGCPIVIILTGDDQEGVSRSRQHELVVDGLRSAAPTAESTDVTIALEPLNTAVDHPGYFLERADEGFAIVDEVDSPAVELLYDVYHQQVSEGNIIETVTEDVDDVGHIHIADVPGRHEPGTGELNYPNIVDAIDDAGYEGYFGFEFTPVSDSRRGVERALELEETTG